MLSDLIELRAHFTSILEAQSPVLEKKKETEGVVEFGGTKEVMQGKQKVQGHYFASVMPKPKDVRFYFFPIYTHPGEFEGISEEIRKSLKGKSCFHVKKLSREAQEEWKGIIAKGVQLYQQDGLI